jgi:hypothetical protein
MDLFPLPPEATYSYGDRFGTRPEDHHGCDIFAAEGTPVLSPVAGVAHAETDPKGGFVVYVQSAARREEFYLAHLADWADLDTADFTVVAAGDLIGHVGKTGNAAGGPPHLHLQAKVDGVLVNPFPLLRSVDPKPPTPADRTFPYPRKPTSSSVPDKGRWTKPGGPSITPSSDARTVSIWTVALILGAIAVWKTFAGNNHA